MSDRFAAYREAGYDFLVLTDHRKVNDVSAYSTSDFLAISGSEVHPDNPYGGAIHHFVAINIHETINCAKMHPNAVLDEIKAQGGEAVLCHPYWSGHTITDYLPLRGYFAIEVYNDGCMEIGKAFSEQAWHDLLDRNGEGELTFYEERELEDFIRANRMLALLKVKTRLRLKGIDD